MAIASENLAQGSLAREYINLSSPISFARSRSALQAPYSLEDRISSSDFTSTPLWRTACISLS